MVQILEGIRQNLLLELDFRHEAKQMTEIGELLKGSGLLVEVPVPVSGFVTRRILVTTKLQGFKLHDVFALNLHSIDKTALIVQIAHCFAYQILVIGVVNTNPHSGNIFCVESTAEDRKREW